VRISGAGLGAFDVPLTDLQQVSRRDLTADFHCVAGWTATDLHWSGFGMRTFFYEVIEPRLPANTTITHLVFGGADGYRSVVRAEDVLDDDVLLADRLDGHPLPPEHGAPLRLVSPKQYGFVSAKHLCAIEVHTEAPDENFGAATALARVAFKLPLLRRHPRARVWHEERHAYLPAGVLRPIYRALIPPIAALSRRGQR
jgi:DMSO/TMAO reductase YedYZ molybdopterin-dependent catalytic subunit